MTRFALLALLCLALTGCATGRELDGSWFLVIARDGKCRQIVHEAKTDQLDTKTTWRGEGCEPPANSPVEP
jgi:hypothetical protein